MKKQCGVVRKALEDAEGEGLPDSLARLLAATVSDSLGILMEERHPSQATCVTLIASGLQTIEKGLEEAASAAQRALEGSDTDKASRIKAKSDADANVKALQSSVEAAKVTLDADVKALKEMSKEVGRVAKNDTTTSPDDMKEALTTIESSVEKLKAEPADENAIKGLLKELKKVNVDETLISMLPTILKKAPSARTSFDAMATQQLEAELATIRKKIEDQEKDAANGASGRAASLEAAQKALEAADAKKTASTQALTDTLAALKEGHKALKLALAADEAPDPKRLTKAAEKARAQLSSFKSGAMTAFNELRDLVKPAETAAPEGDEAEEGEDEEESAEEKEQNGKAEVGSAKSPGKEKGGKEAADAGECID